MVSVIIVMVLGAAIGALTLIVANRNRTSSRLQLKREGEFAVQSIVKALTPAAMVVIDPAQDLDCTNNPAAPLKAIGVRGREGQPTLLICNDDPNNPELSLNGDSLLGDNANYMLTSCSILCYKLDRAYQRYQIDFQFTLKDMKHGVEMPFLSQVVLRN